MWGLGNIILVFGVLTATLGEPRVVVSLSRSQVEVREQFLIRIVAEGGNVGEPILPQIDGIEINPSPASRSIRQSFQIIGGKMAQRSAVEWSFYAWALREGQIAIPPICVPVDGNNVCGQPLVIQVVQGRVPLSQDAPGQQNTPSAPSGQPTLDDVVYIETVVDKQEVFQGEPILLTLRLYTLDMPFVRTQYLGGPSLPLPSMDGFYKGDSERQDLRMQRKGWDYVVQEYRQYLFATAPGTFTIGSWSWDGQVMAHTAAGPRSKRVMLSTQPISIRVQPLPDQPPEFTGAVGKLRADAAVSDRRTSQGVPIQYFLRITGEGNADSVAAPPFPSLPWAHVSEPTANPGDDHSHGIQVDKTFRYDITPLEEGDQVIPAVSYCYFDPSQKKYQTTKTVPITLAVLRSTEAGETVVVGGTNATPDKRVKILGEDLVPIVLQAATLQPRKPTWGIQLMLAVPPLVWFALWARYTMKQQLATAGARRRLAGMRTKRRLQQARGESDPIDALYRTLQLYLEDKLQVRGVVVTSGDAAQLLQEHNVEASLAREFSDILRACERQRYAGGATSSEHIEALFARAHSAIDALENRLGTAP